MDARNELIAQLRAQLAERDGQIAALREYVSDWRDEIYCSPSSTEQREVVKQNFLAKMDGVLSNTAQAAAAHDERVRAEERERCIGELRALHKEACRTPYPIIVTWLNRAIYAVSTAGKEQ